MFEMPEKELKSAVLKLANDLKEDSRNYIK
jgi:hypothetical protein